MSVLTCMRGDCDNCMSERYSYRYGYLCRECFQELVSGGPQDIEEFMKSRKGKGDPLREAWPGIVEQEFERR